MIYKLHVYSPAAGSEGYEFFGSRAAAHARRRELVFAGYAALDLDLEELPTPQTKAQVLALLTRCASHPDNG